MKYAGLRRQGGARRATASRIPSPCSARSRSTTTPRRAGVKRYMLGREPVLSKDGRAARRRARPPLVRDERRRRAVDRQAHPARATCRRSTRTSASSCSSSTSASSIRSPSATNDSTPVFDPENARMQVVRILVCVKRVPITGGKMVLTDDEQAIQTRHLGFTISPHEECGVEEAVRIVGGGRRRGRRADARPGRGRGAVARVHGDRRRPRRSTSSTARSGTRRRPRPRSSTRSVAKSRFDLIVFGNESADAGQLPGRHPRRVRARAAGRHRPEGADGRRGTRALRAGGRRADATSTTSRCPPS